MDTTTPQYIFKIGSGDYYILNQADARTVIKRGRNREPINLEDFSLPLDKTAALAFSKNLEMGPMIISPDNITNDTFWDLLHTMVDVFVPVS